MISSDRLRDGLFPATHDRWPHAMTVEVSLDQKPTAADWAYTAECLQPTR